jgi:CDP-diglyceride synthetase
VPPQTGLKLPSLEWLQAVNKHSLVYSSCFIALGLVAGIVLNMIKSQGSGVAVPWTDSVVVTSTILLVWLLAATLFEWTYKPAQQGRKIAYLTVASFVFLALVMAMLLVGGSQHAAPRGAARFKSHVSSFKLASVTSTNLKLATWKLKPETGPPSEGRP